MAKKIRKSRSQTEPERGKIGNNDRLSLHPLTPEEALKQAMGVGPQPGSRLATQKGGSDNRRQAKAHD
jgi:hypothetical protein